MSWTEDLNADELKEWERFVDYQHEHTLKEMLSSAMVISITSKDPDNVDIKFCVELGMAIMLGKPIMAVVHPDAVVPEKLRLVADELVVVDIDLEEGREELQKAISRVVARLGLSETSPE